MPNIITIKPTNVFPTTKLNSINKLITESNLTKLFNNLLDTDSYLIPPSDSSFGSNTVWDPNLQGLVEVPFQTTSSLECVLKGYYFDLGPIYGQDAIAPAMQVASGGANALLLGQIIIDMTNPEYPELFGEEAEEGDPITVNLSSPWDPNDESSVVPILSSVYRDLDIKNIYATHNNVTYYFTLNENWELVPTQPILENTSFSAYIIEYVSYYSLIKLHVLLDDEVKIPATVPDFGTSILPLGENFISVSLPLLCRYNGNYYFPMTSYPKFTSLSIQSIDGGII